MKRHLIKLKTLYASRALRATASALLLACVIFVGDSCASGQGISGAASPASTTNVPAVHSTSAAAAAGRVEYGEFPSNSLGHAVRYAVSLPASYDQKTAQRYPVVIFLHGLNNDERDWESNGMETKLAAIRANGKVGDFIVAIPYGANSFYLNGKDGTRYEDAIVKDFLPFLDKQYRTKATPQARVIEGLSMGGYGALLIAFKHPELFAGVVAHSAALFNELPKQPESQADRYAMYRYNLATKLFGAPPDAAYFQENNPLYLAKTNADKIKSLKIYFDVGEQDRYGFDAGNKQLDSVLTAAGVRHEFTLAPGGHGWAFLADRTEPAFTFVWNALR